MSDLSIQPHQVPLDGADKAAVLFLALGPALSSRVLKLLTEDHVELVTARMAGLGRVPPKQVQEVLEEFETARIGRELHLSGNLDNVKEVLTEAFGKDQATQLFDRLKRTLTEQESDFRNLRKVEPTQLAKFVEDEHPQAIAFTLAHLDPTHAAGVLAALPADLRLPVVRRIASLGRVSPESAKAVADAIRLKLRNLGELRQEASGGIHAVADLFNRLDTSTCSELLENLEGEDPKLFESVRRFMFVFEDLATIDQGAMKELIQKVDRQMLVKALKGATDELKTFVMSTLSGRAADLLQDDLTNSPPIRLKEVDAAQQEIIAIARQLEKEGLISLKNSPADQYV